MDTHFHRPPTISHWKDVVVLFSAAAICNFLLVSLCNFPKSIETSVVQPPVLAIPRPPAPLKLAPETEVTIPAFEMGWPSPDFQVAWKLPEFKLASEEIASGTKISLLPNEKIPFHNIINRVAGRYEVDPHLIRAIIFAESGYNPKAKSKKGARGLMQLMPSTAEALGVEDIYDPEENIDGGVRYFRTLLDRFDGNVKLALAAYNAGSRHVRNYEGIPPFKATRRYIKKVLKFHQQFKAEMEAISRKLV
jgi:hypothetical protein